MRGVSDRGSLVLSNCPFAPGIGIIVLFLHEHVNKAGERLCGAHSGAEGGKGGRKRGLASKRRGRTERNNVATVVLESTSISIAIPVSNHSEMPTGTSNRDI
tara:strand:+ start:1043 stop:1348 length:306 start_codon:yes stop_codon:yes gene_type:complete